MLTIWIGKLALALALLQANTDAIATFQGKFKSADKKFVLVEVENGQVMRMYITHNTRFIRDGKAAHSADFRNGDDVSVDAERDVRMNLLAVRVEYPAAKSTPQN